ncbi:PTS system glucoside-specific EIICBA component [Clostridium puniceum]|uniref:PTS system glucoside-specific EIICBA component n=1 Tax=Clostridium puniceum TaxID=29367 RepID=A0A1S8TX11_9CLOT|nr:PTS glucose transporter subunit IIA [Clostridium puniceum]OOM82267.1 PTS system glucoside-specific EIICBA component [Clostridium puniceum]
MIDFFKKKKKLLLYSPVSGKCIDLEYVRDKIFSSKMMGNGIAFSFSEDTVCAPCNGKLTMIANTLHAFGIKAENGAEILVHIGLDTVNLNGNGFTKLAKEGDQVKKGDPIIKIDRKVMQKSDIDLTTPMIITNGSEYKFNIKNPRKDVTMGIDVVISFE